MAGRQEEAARGGTIRYRQVVVAHVKYEDGKPLLDD
jgi:hypothetical protein